MGTRFELTIFNSEPGTMRKIRKAFSGIYAKDTKADMLRADDSFVMIRSEDMKVLFMLAEEIKTMLANEGKL